MESNGNFNSVLSTPWPADVGILAMEVYFPSQFVDQEQLEEYDGVSKGKYTIGLGQHRMGFCSDREDINSLCLTVLSRLVARTGIGYKSIGRLEVGTETIIDKSKSVKSSLMELLAASGNTDVEGIDTKNACYGGTAALLNSVNWVESSAWDGRYAVAVAGDIAVYASGAARPTGGAGAVAMLVGPDAPLVIDRRVRCSFMNHSYDFYKPDMSSEYPIVDGKLSIQCYFSALDGCYAGYLDKASKVLGVSGLASIDHVLFHTPYCKLVQKSFARLAFNDFLMTPVEQISKNRPELLPFRSKTLLETYFDRDVEKAFMATSSESFLSKTKPSLLLASQVGNMYTPSLYGGLASLLSSYASTPHDLLSKRICLFSYGSGLASTMFSITVKLGQANSFANLESLVQSFADLRDRLEKRKQVSPEEFASTMLHREKTHHLAPFLPIGSVSDLASDTYYVEEVDDKHRRRYNKTQPSNSSLVNKKLQTDQVCSNGVNEVTSFGEGNSADVCMMSPKKSNVC